MTDCMEVLEAVMDCLLDGVLVFGSRGEVLFCNQPAEAITGYASGEMKGRELEESLKPLQFDESLPVAPPPGHGTLIYLRHKLGHEVPVIARTMALHDPLGEEIGSAVFFHPAESVDSLPHGETEVGQDLGESLSELEDRLRMEYEEFERGGLPFGVLWISIDQAGELRKTHGIAACQEMVGKVHRALAVGLRPGEQLGRWGDSEFLIVAHERTPEMLANHARRLAGLARTADFRWWGDRISITVSIGVAQMRRELNETLSHLLDRARAAMGVSIVEGGNRITSAPKPLQEDCQAVTAVLEDSNTGQSDRRLGESGDAAGGNTCLPS